MNLKLIKTTDVGLSEWNHSEHGRSSLTHQKHKRLDTKSAPGDVVHMRTTLQTLINTLYINKSIDILTSMMQKLS